ncbi:MAG TPA: NAD(P)/FAD-dependent oxidoreductase [Baekduia sp.]|nr:NAD(P)/FAD-dependent oxidoreductase [Baekduia sp.]
MTVLDHPAAATAAPALPTDVQVCVVGAGFSGLSMAAALRRGAISDFVVLEKAADVGGTWRENDYPGCACDVPSQVYSFSFAPNPDWSRQFAPQAEIQAYIKRVVRDEGLLPHIRLNTLVEGADWDDADQRWVVRTDAGTVRAQFLIGALGPLHVPKFPDLPGLERFTGTAFHSAEWDHAHDLAGRKVAVVGTGASAIQFIPAIAPHVGQLHVFQRTAPWIMPRLQRPFSAFERKLFRRVPLVQRTVRAITFVILESLVFWFLDARRARVPEVLGRLHLRRQVKDPELRRKLTPTFRLGCKRMLLSNDYLPALARPNVAVHTEGIREIRERSIVTHDGQELEVDTIIYGTGFHVTDMPAAHLIRNGRGVSLAEDFEGSPHAHRATTFADFPNLAMLLGPNSGLGHNSVVLMAEAQAGYLVQGIKAAQARGAGALVPRREAQDAWTAALDKAAEPTVWIAGGCESWYLDSKGRASTLWPHSVIRFQRLMRRFDAENYTFVPARERAGVAA